MNIIDANVGDIRRESAPLILTQNTSVYVRHVFIYCVHTIEASFSCETDCEQIEMKVEKKRKRIRLYHVILQWFRRYLFYRLEYRLIDFQTVQNREKERKKNTIKQHACVPDNRHKNEEKRNCLLTNL